MCIPKDFHEASRSQMSNTGDTTLCLHENHLLLLSLQWLDLDSVKAVTGLLGWQAVLGRADLKDTLHLPEMAAALTGARVLG